MLTVEQYSGLQTLNDHRKLYNHEWRNSSRPNGQDPGILTNYTQDLLLSMEHLFMNLYCTRRLKPVEHLPVLTEKSTILETAGQTLQNLLHEGRLFYVDHRNQSACNQAEKCSAACDAYCYISPSSGDSLPLATRTNVGSNSIYTPQDPPND